MRCKVRLGISKYLPVGWIVLCSAVSPRPVSRPYFSLQVSEIKTLQSRLHPGRTVRSKFYKDIRTVDIHVNSQGVRTSIRISSPYEPLIGYPHGYRCGYPCRIIRATDSSIRAVTLSKQHHTHSEVSVSHFGVKLTSKDVKITSLVSLSLSFIF